MRLLLLVFAITTFTHVHARQTKGQPLNESEVPTAVKAAYENELGFPVEEWVKLTVNEAPRYVAVFRMLDPATGKMVPNRYRYTANGKLTSYSKYFGSGANEESNFYLDILGDVEASFQSKIEKLLREKTLQSFETFYFVPGNQTNLSTITHRLVLKDKKGKQQIIYFDRQGTEVDITKYPVRKIEAEELD
ncbi:MAG: hypothetical protein KF775_06320 [Cyclobacteriaceae bacterium]|nr:hypothetical protein [Cyclobacteriaceae bacterium]